MKKFIGFYFVVILLSQLAYSNKIVKNDTITDVDIQSTQKVHLEQLNDPYRALWHLNISEGKAMPFDPNGAIFHKGVYHLWYIFQPKNSNAINSKGEKTEWQHEWQHVSSLDLFHWRWHSNSLTPNREHSESGVFSGNAFKAKDGNTVIAYHGWGSDGNSIAYSNDDELNLWTKSKNNPTAKPGWDPHMWYQSDTDLYYQISGSKPSSGKKPIVYTAKNYMDPMNKIGDFMAFDMPDVEWHEDISCPDFFKLEDKWVLVLISHSRGARYYIGEWDGKQFKPESHKRINFPGGPVFAPETLLDDKGRRIFWAWLYDGYQRKQISQKGYSDGVMTMPRVLKLSKDKLSLNITPAKEIENLRYDPKELKGFQVKSNESYRLKEIYGNSLEIKITIDPKKSKIFGVKVLTSEDGQEQTKILIDKNQNVLAIDMSKSSVQNPKYSQYSMMSASFKKNINEYKNLTTTVQKAPFKLNEDELITLRIFIDKSIIEVFVNDGAQSITQVVYPSLKSSNKIEVFSDDTEIEIKKINAWKLFPTMQW